jgi:pyrophosphatase PpaX
MIKTIIFDFDGTIIDTNTLIEEGLNHFALRYRGSTLNKSEHKLLVGKTLEDQLGFISEQHKNSMSEQFKIWYKHHHNQKAKAFPQMVELIHGLKQLGYQIAIVSNNSTQSVEHGLRHLKLERYFDYILTRDHVKEVKPSPEGLEVILTFTESKPDEAIFIGDAATDVLAAKAAGLKSVLVGWSHLDVDDIIKLEPDYVISSALQLLTIIESINETQKQSYQKRIAV